MVAYFMVLPAVLSHHSIGALAALWLASWLVAGWMFAFLFQVSADKARSLYTGSGKKQARRALAFHLSVMEYLPKASTKPAQKSGDSDAQHQICYSLSFVLRLHRWRM